MSANNRKVAYPGRRYQAWVAFSQSNRECLRLVGEPWAGAWHTGLPTWMGACDQKWAVTNLSEVRVEVNQRGWLYVEQLIMTGVCLLIGANTLGSMPSTMSLAGLPLVSTTRTSISESSVQGRDSTSRAEQNIPAITANVWSRLGSHSSSEVLPLNGVCVGAGSSPVPNKVAERIRRWEFVDMAELLPEVRLSGGENEGRLLQRKPRCVTDIIT